MARVIYVAKLGEQYKVITVEGAITYRGLIKLAGFAGTESVMAEGHGSVILDEPVPDSVTNVVVSMPKIAGGALPAGFRIVDEDGNEWRPVSSDTDTEDIEDDEEDDDMWDVDDEEDDDDFEDGEEEVSTVSDSVRVVRVAQIGKPYVEIQIVGATTYRMLLNKAGFSGADGVFAEGRGSVIMDEPVGIGVTSVVVNMPKIAGGTHQ